MEPGFETARLALARVRVDGRQQCTAVAERATRICAQALGVDRVGVWLLEDHDQRLRCWAQLTASTATMTAGETLATATYPAYLAAMKSRRAIVADDARADAATRELAESYLIPHGITSMLDAPLYRDGEVVGVVCHEHVGPQRRFTEREVDFACSVADITATVFEQARRSELEAELRDRAARLGAQTQLDHLSRLSRSVAHDFTNVLTGVGLIAQQLRRSAPRSELTDELTSELTQLVAVGQRLCAELGQQQFFGDEGLRTRVDQVLHEMRSLLTTLIRDNGTLEVEAELEGVELAMKRTHLEQILLNLVVNARDALGPHGTVRIRVRAASDEEGGARFAVIEVRDDGAGMPPDVAVHVFEPYFTTKRTGSGLGLATVRDLVTECKGRVVVTTAPNAGSTFTLILPRA